MAKLTTVEEAHEILEQGYDAEHHRTLYRQMCYAFGDAWDKVDAPSVEKGRLLECPDITVKFLEVGQSRRILNSAFLGMSRAMYRQPEPALPDLHPADASIIQRYLMKRSEGEGEADGEWGTDDAFAYMDWDGLGVGGVQIILTTNKATGLQKVGIQHIPATHVIYDRHERNPGRARWMAFVHHLAPYDAIARFGPKKAHEFITPMFDKGGQGQPLESMRVIEYFTTGLGKAYPTRMLFAGDLDGECLEDEENEVGIIPYAHGTHFVAPGMRRPVGRIALQMSTQEAQNEVERHMRRAMKKTVLDFVADAQIADTDDLQDYLEGMSDKPVRYDPQPSTQPFIRIPAGEASATTLNWSEMLERQYNTDSGQTEMDQGNQLSQDRTLGEAELLDQRSAPQKNWSVLMTLLYHRRKYQKVLKYAAAYDRDPFELPIDTDRGTVPVLFNDPEDPRMGIDRWASNPGRIVIAEEAIENQDLKAERAQKVAELGTLADLVAGGQVSPSWWATKRLKALGFDPNEAAPTPQEMMERQMLLSAQSAPPPAA